MLLNTLVSESFADGDDTGLEAPDVLELVEEIEVGLRNGDTTKARL